jgi:hypothetical protein
MLLARISDGLHEYNVCNVTLSVYPAHPGTGQLGKHAWPGIFLKLARCGYTLRVTLQTSYSPEYITPTQKNILIHILVLKRTPCFGMIFVRE